MRTPISDLFDSLDIAYRWLLHSEPVYTIESAGRQRGVVLDEMVKSILLRDREGRTVMACVLGGARLDTRALQASLPPGWKRLHFASAEEIKAITGCVQGAVAPLALPEYVTVIFDEAIPRCQKVSISSGDPMVGIELLASDLLRAARAHLAAIAQA